MHLEDCIVWLTIRGWGVDQTWCKAVDFGDDSFLRKVDVVRDE